MKKFKALKEKLNKEHKTYYTITIDEYECYLRRPTRADMTVIMKITAKNQLKGIEYMMQTCFLGGDKEIINESDLFLSAASVVEELFETKEAILKKLDNKTFEVKIDKYSCILKKPSVSDLSIIMGLAESDPIKSNEKLLESCWVSGDDVIKTEDELFFGVSSVIGDIIKIREASIKKNLTSIK